MVGFGLVGLVWLNVYDIFPFRSLFLFYFSLSLSISISISFCNELASVAQPGRERRYDKPKARGSNPLRCTRERESLGREREKEMVKITMIDLNCIRHDVRSCWNSVAVSTPT